MKVTRKGYFTVEYGGIPLEIEGAPLTSRDACYPHILNDGRSGVFIIHCPDWEVEVSGPVRSGAVNINTAAPRAIMGASANAVTVPTGALQLGVPRVTVLTAALLFGCVDDDDGNWIP